VVSSSVAIAFKRLPRGASISSGNSNSERDLDAAADEDGRLLIGGGDGEGEDLVCRFGGGDDGDFIVDDERAEGRRYGEGEGNVVVAEGVERSIGVCVVGLVLLNLRDNIHEVWGEGWALEKLRER